MGSSRTFWHLLFAALVRQVAPSAFQTHLEVPLTSESLRADFVLFRSDAPEGLPTEPPGALLGLWDHLAKRTILEFKSRARPYRRRDLYRLCSQMALYYANDEPRGLEGPDDLCGVLIVPTLTPSLVKDAAALKLVWHDLRGGYYRLDGGMFRVYVAALRTVAKTEGDDLVELFVTGRPTTGRTARWLNEQAGGEKIPMEMRDTEGYAEFVKELALLIQRYSPELVLAELAPEQRLAGLAPEQRLAGLAPEQAVLALPDEVLRGLSDEYLGTLPEVVRTVVRARIGR